MNNKDMVVSFVVEVLLAHPITCVRYPFQTFPILMEEVNVHLTCSYLICATPRSGSTLLCEALSTTGLAGYPKEYFEALRATGLPRRPWEYFSALEDLEVIELLEDCARPDDGAAQLPLQAPLDYAEYLAHVLKEGTTPNGVFGAKVMWGYFGDFISNLRDIPAYKELPVLELLSTIFPNLHYIWITRFDKVRQAVSLWRAIQTWTWRKDELSSRPAHQQRDLFHFGAIDCLVQQIEEHERAWQHFLDDAAIQPYRIIYEDLAANYEATALQILRYLDIPLAENLMFGDLRMKRQADTLSEEWVERYRDLKHGYYFPLQDL